MRICISAKSQAAHRHTESEMLAFPHAYRSESQDFLTLHISKGFCDSDSTMGRDTMSNSYLSFSNKLKRIKQEMLIGFLRGGERQRGKRLFLEKYVTVFCFYFLFVMGVVVFREP